MVTSCPAARVGPEADEAAAEADEGPVPVPVPAPAQAASTAKPSRQPPANAPPLRMGLNVGPSGAGGGFRPGLGTEFRPRFGPGFGPRNSANQYRRPPRPGDDSGSSKRVRG